MDIKSYVDLWDGAGEFRLINYGPTHAVLLRGDEFFIKKSFNMFSSFCGGKLSKSDRNTILTISHLYDNVYIVPVNITRLKRGLSTFFYTALYKKFAVTKDLLDSDGEVIDLQVVNQAELEEASGRIAEDFIANGMKADISVPTYSAGKDYSEYTVVEPENEEIDVEW